jgi:hypothetical protein
MAMMVWSETRSVSPATGTGDVQGPGVSYSEQMDTSTPAGKMVFTVLGAVAELERSLTVERVRAGLRNARAKGKTLARPRVIVDTAKIASLRATSASWQFKASAGVPPACHWVKSAVILRV